MASAVQITAAGPVVHHTTVREELEIVWGDVGRVGKVFNVTNVK